MKAEGRRKKEEVGKRLEAASTGEKVWAVGFRRGFIVPILAGVKLHTIRGLRRDGKVPNPKDGWVVRGWTGLRTKGARAWFESRLVMVETVRVEADPSFRVFRRGLELDQAGIKALALADGFRDSLEFLDWFVSEKEPVFNGHILTWEQPVRVLAGKREIGDLKGGGR